MKTIMQIAMECNLRYNDVYDIVKKENITPIKVIGKRNQYDKYQVDYIQSVLYYTGLITEIILESKMNIKETFKEFKERTYGSKPLLTTGVDEITKHYNERKSKYDVEGESYLEYYKQKYPENYNLLKQNYDKYNK